MRPQNRHLKPWKPGQSGNPKGRAKKARSMREDVRRVFDRWGMASLFPAVGIDWDSLQMMAEASHGRAAV